MTPRYGTPAHPFFSRKPFCDEPDPWVPPGARAMGGMNTVHAVANSAMTVFVHLPVHIGYVSGYYTSLRLPQWVNSWGASAAIVFLHVVNAWRATSFILMDWPLAPLTAPFSAWRAIECGVQDALGVRLPIAIQVTDVFWFMCTPLVPFVKCLLLVTRPRTLEVVGLTCSASVGKAGRKALLV